MKTVDLNLAKAIAKATIYWADCRDYLGILMSPDWAEAGIKEHMMREFIHNDTPITARISSLDIKNKAILFRALLKWYGDYPEDRIRY